MHDADKEPQSRSFVHPDKKNKEPQNKEAKAATRVYMVSSDAKRKRVLQSIDLVA